MDKIVFIKEDKDGNITLSKKELEKIINEKNDMEKTIKVLSELCIKFGKMCCTNNVNHNFDNHVDWKV